MIFVSTGDQRHKTGAETAMDYYRYGIRCVELSGGAYSSTHEFDLLTLPGDLHLQVHNYFPPPPSPFVFNLASSDTEISELSMAHVRAAIRLAVSVRRPIYSFHAGFRINPKVSELGNRLGRYSLLQRDIALEQFGDQLATLAEEARREGVTLLVENNVLNTANLAIYGEDPLLLTHPDEIAAFMARMSSNVGLLLDVAHLKVSANTLGFDPVNAHEKVRTWIKGYHLSDNDGTADSNEPIADNSWFWDVLVFGLNYYSLEVYRTPLPDLVKQHGILSAKIAEKLTVVPR